MAYPPPDNLPPPLEAVSDLPAAYAALRERVRQTEEEIARLSSILSHDLRAQLRSVDAFTEFVLEDAGDALDAESRDNLGRVGRTVQAIDHLVQRLVLLERLPRQPLHLETVPLANVLDPALRRLRDAFPKVPAVVEPGAASPGDPVRVDEARAAEALYQLLENAAVFQSRDVAPVRLLLGRVPPGDVSLQVVDRGIGIDAADRARIFELGRRLHGPRAFPGAGVGLYLARRLLEGWARGPALVESAPGRGSTFEITVPAA